MISLCVFAMALLIGHATYGEEDTSTISVVAYNVACGQWTTPEEVADALAALKPDIVFLNEVPKANKGEDPKKLEDWSSRVAKKLGLDHVYVGTISSANHKAPHWGDVTGHYGGKFKSILSRTPLSEGKDYDLKGRGWSPASVVRAETVIAGRRFTLYSLHLPGCGNWQAAKHRQLAELVNAEDASSDLILGGDFNERTGGEVMEALQSACDLRNAITEPSIDHILYSAATPIKVLDAKRTWGPRRETVEDKKSRPFLSDHPWVWCELQVSAPAIGEK